MHLLDSCLVKLSWEKVLLGHLLDSCLVKLSRESLLLGHLMDSLWAQAWGECIRIPSELAHQSRVTQKVKELEPS